MSKTETSHQQTSGVAAPYFGYSTLANGYHGLRMRVTSGRKNSGMVQVLVIVDKFSKYVTLEPCPEEMNAAATAEVLLRRVVSYFGVPEVIISDRGPQFASTLWKELLQSLGTRVALASPHHPQTDGQSERAIQTLLRMVRSYARTLPGEWVAHLPMLQFAMNNAPSASTRYFSFPNHVRCLTCYPH